MRSVTVDVQYDSKSGEYFIELPQDILDLAGFKIGDELQWIDNGDGSWSITKMSNELDYYVVDVLSSFRCRYVVKAKSLEHALDEVVYREGDTSFVEFSQKHLGTNIIDGFKVSDKELIKIHKIDNDYLSSWPDEVVFSKLTNEIDYGENDNVQESDNGSNAADAN